MKKFWNICFYISPILFFTLLITIVIAIIKLVVLEVEFLFILGWIEAFVFAFTFLTIDLWTVIYILKMDKKERITPTKETMKYKGKKNG